MNFYTYLWLREKDGTFPAGVPYYAGKGTGGRAFLYVRHGVLNRPKNRNQILIQYWPDEDTALAYERYLIDFYGRIDNETGCLRNFTDGGEGTVGRIATEVQRRRNSEAHLGKKIKNPRTEEYRKKLSKALRGRKFSDEWRHNLSESCLGKKKPPRTEEHRRNLSEAHSGVKLSAEHWRAVSEAMRGNKNAAKSNRRVA